LDDAHRYVDLIRARQTQLVDDVRILPAATTGDRRTLILIAALRLSGGDWVRGDSLRLNAFGERLHHGQDLVGLQRTGYLPRHHYGAARLAEGESALGKVLPGQLLEGGKIRHHLHP